MRASLAAASAPRAPPCAMDPTADARAVGTRHSHLNVVVLGRAHVSHPHLLSSLIKTSTCPKLSRAPPQKNACLPSNFIFARPIGDRMFLCFVITLPSRLRLVCTGSRLPGLTRQGGKHTLQRPKTRTSSLRLSPLIFLSLNFLCPAPPLFVCMHFGFLCVCISAL